MGYPTLKFFPVNSHKNEYGTTRASYSKEVKVRQTFFNEIHFIEMMKGCELIVVFVLSHGARYV